MKNDRLRVPLRTEYASALGLAVYCFASLEWNAVWCCERIQAGGVEDLSDRTAGRVADTLVHLFGTLDQSEEQVELGSSATDFRSLVGTRNNLVHAKPGTASDGEQAHFRHGDEWTLPELEAVADAFTACGLRLNHALHGFLSR
jgi:hypothetical protein